MSDTTLVNGKLRLDFQAVHTTYKNAAGEKLPGVTTVLGLINKPGLLGWAWNLGKQGIELEAARQHAADVGTIAHGLCEAYLRGLELDTGNIDREKLDRAETSFLKFLDFWHKEQFTVVATERQMVSERLQVGGTLDVLAKRPSGSLALIDLKTSKGLYPEMFIQGAVYAAMHEEITGQAIAEVYIVRIGKEDAEDVEVRVVTQRPERVEAFAALARARRALQIVGVKV